MSYDVIIVGARCAGSSTALLLARKGYRVLLVDKASFPSDTMSGHFIHPRGLACLQRWGILDRLLATDTPRVTHLTLDAGQSAFTSDMPPVDDIAYGLTPRRYIIDTMLAQAAVEAGAELRENCAVQSLLMQDGTVIGIRACTANGEIITEYATMVVGADGMHSLVARNVNAPTYQTHPTKTCTYYSYWSNLPVDKGGLYMRPEGEILTFPTNNNRTLIGVIWPHSRFHEIRRNIATNFSAMIDLVPKLAASFKQAKQEERFISTGDIPNFFRKPYGPGWALVGDAGYHKDPILGQGMSDAFCDAERLTQALDRGLSDSQTMQLALTEYEKQRNVEALPLYGFAMQFASLQPGPEMQQLLPALTVNPDAARSFIGTIQGAVSATDFFAPENIQNIIRSAQHANADKPVLV